MEWNQFVRRAPELGEIGEKCFTESGVLLLGSLRRDGTPRISPVEPNFVDGSLQLGMMWRSKKALDLLRDPRCTLHNSQIDRHNTEGDFKVWGRARSVEDRDARQRFRDVVFERLGWSPEEPNFHVFTVELEQVAWIKSDGNALSVSAWKASEPDRVDIRRLTA